MKKICLLSILILLINKTLFPQNLLLNGSFENNIATGNTLYLSESWDSVVANTYRIDAGIQDLLMSDSCGGASDGNWFVHTTTDGIHNYSAFSLEISSNLIVGHTYRLSYDFRTCGGLTCDVVTSVSDTSYILGSANYHTNNNMVQTFSWGTYIYSFVSTSAGKYLSVSPYNQNNYNIELDNFILEDLTSDISEFETAGIKLFPNPVTDKIHFTAENNSFNKPCKLIITDVTGKEVKQMSFDRLPFSIDLGLLESGTYMLTMNFGREYLRTTIVKE